MNQIKKFIRQLLQTIEIIELFLLLLSCGIGLALTHYASYSIKWNESLTIVLWVIFFFLGSEFLKVVLNPTNPENIDNFESNWANLNPLITIMFFAFSIIPLIRIIMFSIENYFIIYLLCFLGFWFLIRNLNLNLFNYFAIKETISSLMTSFITPLMILNTNGIQIYKIIFPISFFIFLEISAYLFIDELIRIDNSPVIRTGQYTYIGYYTFIKTISILIPFGYLTAFLLLLIQGNIQLSRSLVITLPLAVFILIRLNQNRDYQNNLSNDLKTAANVFALLVEASWIFGLYFLR
jgi:hypothetical protein